MKLFKYFFRFFLFTVLLFGCRVLDYSSGDRSSIFNRFIKPKFPTEYWIYAGDFTQEEVDTIHQGYQNWEPALQKLTATPFHFRFMGYTFTPINDDDTMHVIKKDPLSGNTVGQACLLLTPFGQKPVFGGDLRIASDKSFHTTDQWHFDGWRVYFSNCLEAIVTHEVGHLMGLGHSPNSNDIMCFQESASFCANRKPTPNDEYALEQFYLQYLTNFDFAKNINEDLSNL